MREGIGPLAVGNSTIPIQIAAARLAKRRDEGAKFGVDPAAVIALVVVLANNLPVRGDFVMDGRTDAQTVEGIAPQAFRDSANCSASGFASAGVRFKNTNPPQLSTPDRVEMEVLLLNPVEAPPGAERRPRRR